MEQELQDAEHKIFCMAVQEAARLANEGQVGAGYRCLLSGMVRAEEMSRSGSSWAGALENEYRLALRFFQEAVETDRHRPRRMGTVYRTTAAELRRKRMRRLLCPN